MYGQMLKRKFKQVNVNYTLELIDKIYLIYAQPY